jgi:ribosomal protein S18 acetylase RimI-like enzyme
MFRLEHLRRLPSNAVAFVDEIAEGIAGLYGIEAAAQYRATGIPALQSAIDHAGVDVIAVQEDRCAAGILMTYVRYRIGYVSFLHVLNGYDDRHVERRLIREGVRTLRAAGVDGIVYECVAFGALDLDGTFPPLGFEPIDRAIMIAPLRDDDWASYRPVTSEAGPESFPEIAQAIVDAYDEHPGRRLHVEVSQPAHAADFLRRVVEEDYGCFRRAYIRAAWNGERCTGAIVGCEIAPGYGFVLQVAVRRDSQNQGIGAVLVRDLAHAFWQAGMQHVALGVTLDSPARALYERLGFAVARPVRVYTWRRPDRIQRKGAAET